MVDSEKNFSYNDIATLFNRDHVSILHVKNIVCNTLQKPNTYLELYEMYQKIGPQLDAVIRKAYGIVP